MIDKILDSITVNEQSSIRIGGSAVIYFDPLHIDGAPHDADVIFITHEHYDHFSPADIAAIAGADTTIAAPASMADKIGALGYRVVSMQPGDSADIRSIAVEAIPAYNEHKLFHPRKKGWLGYVVTVGGVRVYVSGDTDATADAADVSCDIALVPVGGTYTMDAMQAASLIVRMRPAAVIPTHYGTIVGSATDGDDFVRYLGGAVPAYIKLG